MLLAKTQSFQGLVACQTSNTNVSLDTPAKEVAGAAAPAEAE